MKLSTRVKNRFKPRSKKKTAQSQIPFRLNFLMWAVGILLLLLIGRLFYLQVLNGDTYKADVSDSDTSTETTNVQRGMIYDSTGKVLVGNAAHQAITYTRGSTDTSAEIYRTANILGKYLNLSVSTLTKRNKIDYYLVPTSHQKRVLAQIPGHKGMSESKQSNEEIKYLENHPGFIKLTSRQKIKAMIYADMSSTTSLETTYIKETGVTSKEIAEVGEHLNQMTGIKVGTSWTRNYPQGKAIASLTGTVSNSKTGLPSDSVNELLSEGYSRNDSVGISYLEQEYQSTLAGTKKETEVSSSGNSNSVQKAVTKYEGKKGDNLVLTINSKFQNKVQSILKSDYEAYGSKSHSTGAYIVVMNPNTGAIYAMGGLDRNTSTGKITNDQIGSINHSIVMGSVVKGATVMGALMKGVITPSNNTLYDQPIKIAGTPSKSSWWNTSGKVAITAEEALEVSSNSYMMQLAMKEGNFTYSSGAALTMKKSIFTKLRNVFNQFGLGVKTGIDLPGETTGYTGPTNVIGKALDLSYGNYDSYTVMQLAQYASTIANGGYRMKPYIVKEIRGTNKNGSLGPVESTTQPTVLNTINANQSDWNVVRQGMYMVVHGSSPYKTGSALEDLSPAVAAKTGTAETFAGTTSTLTHSLIMFGPYKNPKVVVAIAVPGADTNSSSIAVTVGHDVYKAFWKYVEAKNN